MFRSQHFLEVSVELILFRGSPFSQSACLLLRVDDIVSAKRPQGEGGPGVQQGEVGEEGGGA